MNKEDKLKIAISKKYKSLREFSRAVGIPNTTIVSALENGIGGMAVDKVLKICEVLNLNVNTFDPIQEIKYTDLTMNALSVARSYENAEPHIQAAIRAMLKLDDTLEEYEERKNA